MEESNAIDALSALAHPGRLSVFRMLVRAGPEGVAAGDIARAQGSPANTLSAQLAILARSGLVRMRREGRSIVYFAHYAGIGDLLDFLMQDCCQGRAEICAPVIARATCCPAQEEAG